MKLSGRLLMALAIAFLPALALAQQAPNVTIELLEIDPANVSEVPLKTPVYGHIRYETDAPVRLVILPYRNGEPVEKGPYSGSPDYAPGSGETIAWFAFDSPRTIDEVRAVASDDWGKVFAEASIDVSLTWRAGVAAPVEASWVARLKQAPRNIVEAPPPDDGVAEFALLLLLQLVFLCVPGSVALQIYALRKLEGSLKQLARFSAYAMGALWVFVIVTGLAGSNLSPIWVVFLSPLFVAFLLVLFFRRSRLPPAADAALSPPGA